MFTLLWLAVPLAALAPINMPNSVLDTRLKYCFFLYGNGNSPDYSPSAVSLSTINAIHKRTVQISVAVVIYIS